VRVRHIARLMGIGAVLGLALVGPVPAQGQELTNTRPIATGGFGDARNTYAWSMQWFKGKLYVGTARSALCVERVTLDFYFPGKGYYAPDAETGCPADRSDLDLRAEIWRYDPGPRTWTRVFRSPADIPDPRAPGRFVARDIGFRGMTVYRDSSGKRALYVGGVTADEYIPELAASHPPRLLRSTDGEHFAPVAGIPATIDTVVGSQPPIGYRAMAVYRKRLFVTASGGLTGDGVILEVKNPASASPTVTQVSPATMAVFELQTFGGGLYVGTGSAKQGYGVFRADAAGGAPLNFTPVVTGGAGRGSAMTSVVAMHPYRNRLYVGASGWYAGIFPASELIRVDRDGRWDVVVGNSRLLEDGTLKWPVSGFSDGFGNVFNAHFWRAQEHEGALLVGTNDWSWSLRDVPVLGPWLKPEFGFDLYGTCDGQYWWTVTRDGFGRGLYNFGVRTMASTPTGGYIGTTNHVQGTSVLRSTDAGPCAAPNQRVRTGVLASAARSRPDRLLADAQRRGTVLSWGRARGAVRYRVMRARYHVARGVSVPRRPALRGGYVPDDPPLAGAGGTIRASVPVAGRYRQLGTATTPVFIDRTARRGGRYAYRVVAVRRSGRASPASNTVLVPSERPVVTFADADAAVRRLDPTRRPALRRMLATSRHRWARGDRRGAVRELERLIRRGAPAQAGSATGRVAAEDASDVALRLARRLRYAGVAGG
jgi:hypothetical protein